MATEFQFPDLGEGVDAGDVVGVLVAEGDAVGIDRAQVADLRQRLATFAEDWESPEMCIYDNYDATQVNLQTR